jgi:ribosomal protein S18 acetylase RimI-like enzyme
MSTLLESLSAPPRPEDIAGLTALLRDAVEGGASVGFMLTTNEAELTSFWHDTFEEVRAGKRVVIVARDAGKIVGTVQLELASKPNSTHRAELQKLLVFRAHRGQGLGCALIDAAEATARTHHRTLIVLDTSATGNALGVYRRCGYIRAGVIPRYARDPDGPLIDTEFYYKELAVAAERASGSTNSAVTAAAPQRV